MSDNIWALNHILGSECGMYLAGAIRRASGVNVPYAVIGSTVYHPSLFHFYYVITCTSISKIFVFRRLNSRTRNQEIFGQKLADYAVDCLWILVIVMQ